jgi:hypothetical protein
MLLFFIESLMPMPLSGVEIRTTGAQIQAKQNLSLQIK